MFRFLKYLLQLIISPGHGWEDISHESKDAKSLAIEGLYPLLGITAISSFIAHYDNSLVFILQQAIITFVQFFISYFFSIYIFSMYLPKYIDGDINEKRNMTFITYNLAIMAVIKIISNCLPVELSIVQFLPVFVAIVIWKGSKYMAVNKHKMGQFLLLSIASIIIVPYLLQLFFNLILPS